jgi:hypothetical protein
MEYFDLHVRFRFHGYGEEGFSRVGVWGETICEYADNGGGDKLALLESGDVPYLKPRIKRCSFIHDPDYHLDMGVIRAAARYGKPFEIPVRPLLLSSGEERANLMRRISRFLRVCNKCGADYALTSRAENRFETKRPQELVAMGRTLGLSHDQALRAITEVPGPLLKV